MKRRRGYRWRWLRAGKQTTGRDSCCHQEGLCEVGEGLDLRGDGAVKAGHWQMRCPVAAPVHEGLPGIQSHHVWAAKDQPVAIRPGRASGTSVDKPVLKTVKD